MSFLLIYYRFFAKPGCFLYEKVHFCIKVQSSDDDYADSDDTTPKHHIISHLFCISGSHMGTGPVTTNTSPPTGKIWVHSGECATDSCPAATRRHPSSAQWK
ncbi:uncharacterized protein LOC124676621 [Lolium rigidum]|uniref:uncharacterized protein LOC124676621 n=1 Tax=Lolium rigidum TaxID=89674 RepID=UPI001F5E1383|nr:uncharacterized protein LOC124676621 [Lolium rigidum]